MLAIKEEVKGGNRMAVSMRERPLLKGNDAKRFLERSKKNEEFLKRFAEKKVKEYHERLNKKN